MKKYILLTILLFVFQGCGSGGDKTVQKINETELPFPPMENYKDLDEDIKPPSLNG